MKNLPSLGLSFAILLFSKDYYLWEALAKYWINFVVKVAFIANHILCLKIFLQGKNVCVWACVHTWSWEVLSYGKGMDGEEQETGINRTGFRGGSDGKESACKQETWVWSLGWEVPLEKGMATHSSILAWEVPWTEEPGRLPSTGLQTIRRDWATNSFAFTVVL